MFEFNFFKESGKIEYIKFHKPIGKVFSYIGKYKKRIYETHRLLVTPFGSIRLTVKPHSS